VPAEEVFQDVGKFKCKFLGPAVHIPDHIASDENLFTNDPRFLAQTDITDPYDRGDKDYSPCMFSTLTARIRPLYPITIQRSSWRRS
jgi:hypothetical protein